ncbi:hypothetical protein PYCC9005_002043 [Savitreella phatthalungensis]
MILLLGLLFPTVILGLETTDTQALVCLTGSGEASADGVHAVSKTRMETLIDAFRADDGDKSLKKLKWADCLDRGTEEWDCTFIGTDSEAQFKDTATGVRVTIGLDEDDFRFKVIEASMTTGYDFKECAISADYE